MVTILVERDRGYAVQFVQLCTVCYFIVLHVTESCYIWRVEQDMLELDRKIQAETQLGWKGF